MVDVSSSRLLPPSSHQQPPSIVVTTRIGKNFQQRSVVVVMDNNGGQTNNSNSDQETIVNRRKSRSKLLGAMFGFNSSILLFVVIALLLLTTTSNASKPANSELSSDSEFLFDESDVNAMQDKEFSKNIVSPMSSPIVKSRVKDKKVKKREHLNGSKDHHSNSSVSSHHKHNSYRKPSMSSKATAEVLSTKHQQHKKEHHNKKHEVIGSDHHDNKKQLKSAEKKKKIYSKKGWDLWASDDDDDVSQQIDDEDYIGDQASGSGMIPDVSEGDIIITTPPTTDTNVVYYRMIINARNLTYDSSLALRNSTRFQQLSELLMEAIQPLYDETPGQQVITVVKFTPAPVGCLVTTDLGTVDYYDEEALKDIVVKQLRKRSVGSYEVSEEGFSFKHLGKTTKPPGGDCEEEDQFLCLSGECIDATSYCDTITDCEDGSDERDCPETKPPRPGCRSDDQILCEGGFCIDSAQLCDGNIDCPMGEDETDCGPTAPPPPPPCNDNEHRCDEGTKCIDASQVCDGKQDCIDATDEHDNCPPTECPSGQFRCTDGECVDQRVVCDARADCRDGSDELPQHCTHVCTEYEFECDTGACIDSRRKCDGHNDCSDGSDERSCQCASNEFRCSDNSCIQASLRCNGRYDCADGLDEQICQTCSDDAFQCSDGNCVPNNAKCDGIPHCRDHSDEIDCGETPQCSQGEVECGDGSCVSHDRRCDGRFDCIDGTDERNCIAPEPECTSDQFTCHDNSCIDKARKCDGRPDCSDGSDEIRCDECANGLHRCGDGTCINGAYRCDGRSDCSDRSDEIGCDCDSDHFKCGDGACIDKRRHCDSHYDCSDGSDEQNCGCTANDFTCDSGECIDSRRKCDGSFDCYDRSDERNCPHSSCLPHQFRCNDGSCIDKERHCNRQYDCPDFSDEINCEQHSCSPSDFRCTSGQCIQNRRYCDGQRDCLDGSDEINCALRGDIHLVTTPTNQDIQQGREVVIQCRDEGTQRANVKWSRLGHSSLPPNSTYLMGRLTMPHIQVEHSGVYVCSVEGVRGLSPERVEATRVFSNLTVIPFEPPTTRPAGICGILEATCRNGQCIPAQYRCDNDYDCTDGSDEIGCRGPLESCQPNEFQCQNKKCILKVWRCDGDDDCGDNSDESVCVPSNTTGYCTYREFKCEQSDQCIPRSFQCDSHFDCQDRTDEIGCSEPTVVTPPVSMVVVNTGDRIVLECLAVGVPVPIISWRLNWGHIPPPPRVTTTSENGRGVLIIHSAVEFDSGAYTCEAINSKGFVLGIPDANVIVRPGPGICQPPYFNINAKGQSECLRCFCFSVTNQCTSSFQFYETLPHGAEINVIAVPYRSSGTVDFDGRTTSALNQDLIVHHQHSREFAIDETFTLQAPGSILFWSLPSPFLGNKLGSYGGFLKYTITTEGSGRNSAPDVVVKGNGVTIYYHGLHIATGLRSDREVHFWEGVWRKLNPSNQPDSSDSFASREDLMLVLQNIDSIWIRASYFYQLSKSSLIDLRMDTAVTHSDGRNRTAFVEQCTCPDGYTGLSCESCASGYIRVSTGQYLGECRKSTCDCHSHSDQCDVFGNCHSCQHNTEGSRCERCRTGYYGDARQGSPYDCKPCQCPLSIPSNQFSKTCILDVDKQPTCNSCAPGYTGRHCDKCVAGYYGDPTIPGSGCTITPSPCNDMGSISPLPDSRTGLCQCKDYVAGPTCSYCQPEKFHLNIHSLGGCINCFCMGVASVCSSSNLYRSEEQATFISGRQDFALTNLESSHIEEDRIRVNTQYRELSFRDFTSLPPGQSFYWKLPKLFLGNKLTSYGGNLTYTITYEVSVQGLTRPGPDVQISGNRITLEYLHSSQPQAFTTETISVPLFERYWKRSDGQPATREHLMMALAKLDKILIKAMYNNIMISSSLRDVKLETSVSYNNGQRQSVEVEQCRCPVGYKGTSCEECDIGYARTSGGLYLGLCEPCFCNGHSSDCDPETGICRNCQHDTTGDFCEQCVDGTVGDAGVGTPYDCRRSPSLSCSCDERGTLKDTCSSINRCTCKRHVKGDSCNQCVDDFYNLESRNPDGCTECFCFGVVKKCSSHSYYRSTIYPTNDQGFTVTDRYQRLVIENGVNVTVNGERNQIGFNGFNRQDPSAVLYLSLPSQFTGNRLTSYGGRIKFTLRYLATGIGQPFQDADIMINGNDLSLIYTSQSTLRSDSIQYYDVELTEKHWQVLDLGRKENTTREHMLTTLANVQSILIRITHSTNMKETVVLDVKLGSATPEYTQNGLATEVEICECPPGYAGISCEVCALGYVRDSRGSEIGRGTCIPCNCHGHSDVCDPNSRTCHRCRHNTIGPNCDRCAEGYYGDPTVGTPDDCKPCPCPLSISSNQFSRSCYLDFDGQPTCQGCPIAYTGRTCDKCSPGYIGNPNIPGDTCRREVQPPTTIIVQIQEPKYQQVSTGETVVFVCIGYSQVRDVTYNVAWTRDDGRPLPSQAQDSAGTLTIRDVGSEDSGTYVCTGSDLYGVATDKAILRVSGSPSGPPIVRIDQPSIEVSVGQFAEFRCHAEGYPRPTITWTRSHSSPLNPHSTVDDGVLRILSVSKFDEGDYYCSASNSLGEHQARAVLFVKDESTSLERVYILPSSVDARLRETVRLDCRVEGATSPVITWSRASQPLPAGAVQVENMLILPTIDETFRGIYVCTATSREGTIQSQASVNVVRGVDRPTARIDPDNQLVAQGSSIELYCQVNGEPTPTVEWSKAGESLPANHQISGTTLKLLNLQMSDRGHYVCLATNEAGSAQAYTSLEVERREPPAIELYPENSQTISIGGQAFFQCRVTAGAPSPTVNWTREDRRTISSNVEIINGGIIRFNSVTANEQGRYICTANNSVGTVTGVANLIIQGLPEITISPSSPYTVSVGQKVRIDCYAKGDPLPSVYWKSMLKRDNIIRSYSEISSSPGSVSLEINSAQLDDSDYYVCTAQNSAGISEERIQLTVTQGYAPIQPSSREFVVKEGNQAELRCNVEGGGSSQVSIKWVREDRSPLPADFTELEGMLVINNVKKEDAGTYSCLGVANGTVRFSIQSRLIVVAPPRITVSPLTLAAHPGEDVHFRCQATGDEPIHLEWRKVSGNLRSSSVSISGGDLVFRGVNVEDAGRYVCTARNHVGTSEGVAEVYVNVVGGCLPDPLCGDANCQTFCQDIGATQPPPPPPAPTRPIPPEYVQQSNDPSIGCDDGQIGCVISNEAPHINIPQRNQTVVIGSTVDLVCDVRGHPTPTIFWTRDQGELPFQSKIEGNVLKIQQVRVEDGGRYICSANNEAGTTQDFIVLNVQVEPCGYSEYRCQDGRGCIPSQNVCDGHNDCQDISDEFYCSGQPCTPPAFFVSNVTRCCVQWYRQCDGVVDCADQSDEYFCNVDSSRWPSALLRYQRGISPLAAHTEASRSSVRLGDSLDVRCVTSGDSTAKVSWTKVGGSLPSNVVAIGDKLTFHVVQQENLGFYRCRVDGFAVHIETDYELKLQNIPSFPQTRVETVSVPLGKSGVLNCKSDRTIDIENTIPGSSVKYNWVKQGGVMPHNATMKGPQLIIPESRVDDAGTYICTITTGPVGEPVEVPVVFTVTGVVPHFAQAPVSYIALPTLPDAYLKFDIEISFKPETPDGLILYNGQKQDGEGDFISLGMSRGHVEFRFDVGFGPAILRSHYPVELSQWHTVRLHRNKKEGQMIVVGQSAVNGSAAGRFQGLDLVESLYIGGVPRFSGINKLSGFDRGFVGCISRLNIGGTNYDFRRDHKEKVGVTTCETCAVNPCYSRGACQEALTPVGHKCLCQPGYSGLNCEKIGESCYPGLCGIGRCVDRHEGFYCNCPFGKTGRKCEKDITIYELAFRDDAFAAYSTSKITKRQSFHLKIKPRSLNDGLILYAAQSESGTGDFVSLSIKNKRVEFKLDTGSGATIIRSNYDLKEDEWVTVKAERHFREGTLTVNNEEVVRARSPGTTRGLNLRTLLYIGGVDKHKINVSPSVDSSVGFDGCISELEVGGLKIDMINAIVDASNVDDCGGHTPCERQPCLNGGSCKETGTSPNDYVCECEEGFSGKNCEEEDDICNVIFPCKNGGTCVGTASAYRCNCVLGFSGTNCEHKSLFSERASFQGNGYIELSRDLLPHTSSSVNEIIELSFSTKKPNGIILWHGQKPDTNGKGQDYFMLAVSNGYLVFGYELGSGPAVIRSPVKVDDGKSHRVVLKRMGMDGSLELDEINKEYGNSQGVLLMLNTRGNIYIGGTPNIPLMTAGQYTDGFVGCIDSLEIHPHGVINLMHNAVGGTNVASCDSHSDEEFSGNPDILDSNKLPY
ncbi:hypothetical protein CHUAL_000299 [Chamberlinius hualienensis]